MKWITVFVLLISLLGLAGQASPKTESPAKAKLDYFVVLLNRPANPPQISKEAGDQLQDEHMANIRKMYAGRKLVIAGPCSTTQRCAAFSCCSPTL